jgi:2-dehydro-3-deoxyphosphogluconate aldolase/(4S)-4-hydroxy-2-oxoglutarate aldolase
VKALRSVLPDVPLIPTGGVDLGNLRAYLDAGVHSVGVGGALSPPDLRDAPALARRYRAAARELAPSHGGSPRR